MSGINSLEPPARKVRTQRSPSILKIEADHDRRHR